MKKIFRKDRKRRERVDKHWKERIRRKSVREDKRSMSLDEVKTARVERLGRREGRQSYVRNRCVETGNGRSVIRRFRLSGLRLRENGLKGELPGVYKISW
jgi:small subunit ribosomal protein S14